MNRFTKVFVIISLAFWGWILIDLFTHPVAVGPNAGGNLFRWLSALTASATVVTALFIMRRVQGNLIGPLLLTFGVGAASWSLRREWADSSWGIAALAAGFYFFCISCPAAILLCFHFPTGKVHPPRLERWMPAVAILLAILGLFSFLFSPWEGLGNITNPLAAPALAEIGLLIYGIGLVVGMCAALASLVIRYRAGDVRQRLQLRWLVWLLGMAILVAVFPFGRLFGERIGSLALIVSYIFWQSFPALGIGVAILRHNLWGIDVIIRRTLQYALLSGLLGLIYFGGVVLLQSVLGRDAAAGPQSPAVIVVTTLAIAALFSPLRRRVQEFIDRRFYRQKYDAERALAEFAAAARAETDLQQLSSHLMETIQETLQPKTAQLWLTSRQEKNQ